MVLLALAVLPCVLGQLTWRNCGSAQDIVKINKVVALQDVPEGKFVMVAVQGNLSECACVWLWVGVCACGCFVLFCFLFVLRRV